MRWWNIKASIKRPISVTLLSLKSIMLSSNLLTTGSLLFPVPQPLSVDLSIATPAPYLAGRGIQLTCTATLANAGISFDSITAQFVWKRGDEIIDTSNSRISITDLVSAGNTRSQQLSIDPLSYSSDSHDGYTCEVILAVRNTDITSYPMASHTVPVNVQGKIIIMYTTHVWC